MSDQLVESFARHFMVAIDAWQEHGFGAVARSYLERLPAEKGLRRDIDDNGDLLIRRMGKAEAERKKLLAAARGARLARSGSEGTARREAVAHHPARCLRHLRVREGGRAGRMGGVRRLRVLE